MSAPFASPFTIRWADYDLNGHVRHTAYLDYCATSRVQCLASVGLTYDAMARLGIGPVILRETIDYLRELRGVDQVEVRTWVKGQSRDGRKWRIYHEIWRPDGVLAAKVELDGTWLDLRQRKMAAPAADVVAMMSRIPKTADFEFY